MAYYRKKQLQELIDWTPDFPMTLVSISEADKNNGSPKEGDKIAYNPKDPTDMWLVAKQFFDDNYEFVSEKLLPKQFFDDNYEFVSEKTTCSFTYSLNMMGPWTLDWYRVRGLLRDGQPTDPYAGGRIDIRGDTESPYGDEYGVAPMRSEDWHAFNEWLGHLDTTYQWTYRELLEGFEKQTSTVIRWADDPNS